MNHMTYTAWRLARDSVPGDVYDYMRRESR